MIHEVSGGRRLSPAIVDQIVGKTDGVPLYIEELTKWVLESGAFGEASAADPAEGLYSFKHALLQDAAYESLLKSRRQVLHRRIAETMRDHFLALAETQPEVIAHHFGCAGVPQDAVEWWGKAGERSLRRSAYVEAVGHFRRASACAESLPDVPAIRHVRLRLQIACGNALIASRGHHAAETSAVFARATELAAGLDEAVEGFSAYFGLWVGHYVRGEIGRCANWPRHS